MIKMVVLNKVLVMNGVRSRRLKRELINGCIHQVETFCRLMYSVQASGFWSSGVPGHPNDIPKEVSMCNSNCGRVPPEQLGQNLGH